MTPNLPALAPMTVLTVDKEAVPVGSAWQERPAVLVWLRHFG